MKKALVIGNERHGAQECEAELVKPLREGSEIWFVQFPRDRDAAENPIQRIRRVVRFL